MMRLLALCCVLGAAGWSWAQSMQGMPLYDQRYDYLDVDGILDSRRLVRNYVDCLINVKPCTPEGKALRRILPEALRTKCARCSDRQKRVAVKVISRLKSEYPLEWSKLAMRWDPTGDFSAYFQHVLAKETAYAQPDRNEVSGRPLRGEDASPPLPPPATDPVVLVTPPPVSSTTATSPVPLLLNRFGDEQPESSGSASSAQQPSSARPATAEPPSSPTAVPWESATGSPAPSNPTRFTLRPPGGAAGAGGAAAMPPLYATTVTLIDHFGNKLMRTSELVAELLRSTVRVFGG